MCAFYRKEGADDAYTLTPQEIEQRIGIAKQMGATEVHIVGGFHPKLPLEYYEDMMKIIKKNHIKPFLTGTFSSNNLVSDFWVK